MVSANDTTMSALAQEDEQLQRLGAEEWELVSVARTFIEYRDPDGNGGGSNPHLVFYFKRRAK